MMPSLSSLPSTYLPVSIEGTTSIKKRPQNDTVSTRPLVRQKCDLNRPPSIDIAKVASVAFTNKEITFPNHITFHVPISLSTDVDELGRYIAQIWFGFREACKKTDELIDIEFIRPPHLPYISVLLRYNTHTQLITSHKLRPETGSWVSIALTPDVRSSLSKLKISAKVDAASSSSSSSSSTASVSPSSSSPSSTASVSPSSSSPSSTASVSPNSSSPSSTASVSPSSSSPSSAFHPPSPLSQLLLDSLPVYSK